MMNPITWNPGSSPVNGPTINSMAMVSVIAASIVTAKRRRPNRIVNREAHRMSAAVTRATLRLGAPPRRRVSPLRYPTAGIAVPQGRADDPLGVPPRQDHGGELQPPAHHAGEFEAPGRAFARAVEQPDEGPAVELLT